MPLQMILSYESYIRQYNRVAWPERKSHVKEVLHPYYDYYDELTHQDQLVFKGPLIILPAALQNGCLLYHIYRVDGCIWRARESMFWPRMVTKLKEYISKCDMCMESILWVNSWFQSQIINCPEKWQLVNQCWKMTFWLGIRYFHLQKSPDK